MTNRIYFRLFKDVMAKLSIEQLAAITLMMGLPELSIVHGQREDDQVAEVDFVTDYFDHFVAQVPDNLASHRKLAQALTLTNPQDFAKLLDAMVLEIANTPAVVPGIAPKSITAAPVVATAPTTPNAPQTVVSHGGEFFINLEKIWKIFIF